MPEKQEKKKFVLAEQPFLEIRIKAYRMWREDGTGGVMMMTGPGGVEFAVEKDGKDVTVGYIRSEVMGRALEICDNRRPYKNSYSISMDELWKAFQNVLDHTSGQELKEGT